MLTDRPPRALHSSTSEVGPASHRQLVAYFRSGWAFLIPYLAAYLLYAWLKWPVNPVAAGSSPVGGGQLAVSAIGALPSTVTPSTAHSLLSTGVPCLLHVYWFLHALHLVLGALALRAWWRESSATVAGATDDSENTANHSATPQPSTVNRSPSTVPLRGHRPPSTVYRLLPWLLLALLFYIPGVYLEFPSDSWAHYARMNEWHILVSVTDHSTWLKSSYFLSYSFLSWATGLRQLYYLNFYFTGICLLLCWQYYRLAQTCGLSKRSSMVFVLFQSLLFGNNIFSFYRYYGISSSIYSLLGAVALTRIALEAAQRPIISLRSLFNWSSASQFPPAARILFSAICLLALIAFNHVQGLGIAGFGLCAVVVWRLIEWRRSMLAWLALAAILTSASTVHWVPRHPAFSQSYVPEHWLNSLYGFNLFSLSSPAFDKAAVIIGFSGILNIFAALLLLRRNSIIAWITLMPVILLCLPLVTIPLINLLASHSVTEIITFHRLFFAIPAGLALVTVISELIEHVDKFVRKERRGWFITFWPSILRGPAILMIPISLCLMLTLDFMPLTRFGFIRAYHSLMRPATDLTMSHWVTQVDLLASTVSQNNVDIRSFDVAGVVYRITSRTPTNAASSYQLISYSLASGPTLTDILAFIRIWPPDIFLPQTGREVFSPYSFAGYLSGHWLPQKAALVHFGGREFVKAAPTLAYEKAAIEHSKYYYRKIRELSVP